MRNFSSTSPTKHGGGLRAAHSQRTREAIQSSALKLAAEHGYDATTIEDIAVAAGVSRRTVFNYFPSKADMFIRTVRAPSHADIEAFVTSTGNLLADLATLIANSDAYANTDAEDFNQFRIILRHNPALLTEAQARIRLFHSVIRAAIARRFQTTLTDPRVIAAFALMQALQRGALMLWAGSDLDLTLQNSKDSTALQSSTQSLTDALAVIGQEMQTVITPLTTPCALAQK